ncbi:Calcium-transporting ATPase 1 [Bacteroides xylanisolvens]|uniref:P-type Ca(2+) transporter n=1 Tax=Bacteroides eggerthii TaxID=28111 RepID=A0A975Q7X4_9BACE|nr:MULTISPECIES: calcium-translocating P-type ATPase, PMCA-type [Bacteroides]QUT29603.1 Calcium-transporting ATPase 1 [Bacteroides xylanisolvens]QUT46733.1 Calcium-transporting ATPase 1 [Bacteroides eggerthii]
MEQKQHYTGLTDKEVNDSREMHGANILTPPEKDPLWKQFLEKFEDPLIIILMIAGALSVGISFYEYFGLGQGGEVFFEPAGIFVAILLATGLAFYFELQADKEFTILNQVNDDEPVEVIRNGNVTQIPRKDVVVGDIVILNTGEEVAADGELLEAVQLHLDESTLTGEPVCGKSVNEENFDKNATYPTNHVMKGTKVMEGHGAFRVLAVGDRTEQGKVFEAAQIDDSVKTPLNEQLDGLSDWITKISYGFAALIIVGRIAVYLFSNGTDCFGSWELVTPFIAYVLQTLMIAVTLVVVAVPEGLPMAVTLSLAYSMRRMLRTNNLVRKMHACETMGATTVICTDKTGTLTQNQMSVDEIKVYDNAISENVIYEGMAVNSTASIDFSDARKLQVLGNPTEGALLLWMNGKNVDYRTIRENISVVEELPFTTERKYMATVVESAAVPGKKVLYVKGAPEIVFGLCSNTDVDKTTVDKQLLAYQERAMRTLGFAYQVLEGDDAVISNGKVEASALKFIGVAAIADPVRADVPAAVKECLDAGITVKIVTGDTPGTAKEIGRQIGLWTSADTDRNIITGPEFAALTDEQLLDRVLDLKIIARARPMDKKRLVEALQKKNQVVAVTGDGTNDAPALHSAHVGLSMGDGTSVAKEASDITIIDNSFSSIGKAVMWGRSLYQNIQRFLLFQLTVNVTACFLVLFGAFMGTESPLTVTQMLWINLIMDTFAAMALASLPPSESVMRDKPRDRNAFILNKQMIYNIVGVGGFFFFMLLGLLYIFQHADVHQLTDLLSLQLGEKGHVTTYELTLLFTIFVMTHFFYLFNARAFETGRSALHFKSCKGLLTIVAIILVGQIAMVELPGLQQFFNVCGLSLQDWIIIILGSSLVLWAREGWHLITRK